MKKLILLLAIVLSFSASAYATKIKSTDLAVLVARAEYIVVGKVVKVDMIDANGHQVLDKKIKTGFRSGNTIRYYVDIDRKKTLKGNSKSIPRRLVLPDWNKWIRSLKGAEEDCGGQTCIFLLSGPNFSPAPPAEFMRDIDEKKEIEKILKSQPRNIKP